MVSPDRVNLEKQLAVNSWQPSLSHSKGTSIKCKDKIWKLNISADNTFELWAISEPIHFAAERQNDSINSGWEIWVIFTH